MVPHSFTLGFLVTSNTCKMVKATSDSEILHTRCMAYSQHLTVTGALRSVKLWLLQDKFLTLYHVK